MARHLYTLLRLLIESLADRRDAQVRFLKEEDRILRARIDSQRLILTPGERYRLNTLVACDFFAERSGPRAESTRRT